MFFQVFLKKFTIFLHLDDSKSKRTIFNPQRAFSFTNARFHPSCDAALQRNIKR